MKYNYKKHPIKVKHRTKNLYNKKKSKGKTVLAVVLTITGVAALGVLGFGLGRPLMDYINAQKANTSENVSAWTPPEPETSSQAETTATSQTTTAAPEEEPVPAEVVEFSYILPENAALNSGSLKSAIAAAKNSGCNSVTVTLKSDMGKFLYKSELEDIAGGEIIEGELTAKQIYNIIEKAGLVPVARINTTKDHCSGNYVDGTKFELSDGWGWLDNSVERGGKAWLNPFNDKTSEFIASVTDEITKAGFKTIILANTIFPTFSPSDYTTYLSHEPISDSAKRTSALWKIVNTCTAAAEKNGAVTVIEFKSDDLSADDKFGTTAELSTDRSQFTKADTLITYTPDGTLPTPAAGVAQFIGKMNGMYPGMTFSVRIENGGFSAQAEQEVRKAFAEAGITVYVD